MKIYHTETQADYDSLMVELEKQGATWNGGEKFTEINNWPEFESQTGIKLQDGILTYHGVEYFERVNPETPIIKYTVTDKTEPVYIDIDGAKITVDETHTISFEEAMALVENRMVNEADEIADKCYETPDIINEPNHYKGKHGIETIDVIRNFGNDDMVAGFYWGNAIKYMTRYRNKNGLEDLKKARRNLDWLIEHTEKVE